MLSVWEGLLRWKCTEAAHVEPLGSEAIPLPDLSQDIHLSKPPEEAPEKPLEHELSQGRRQTQPESWTWYIYILRHCK